MPFSDYKSRRRDAHRRGRKRRSEGKKKRKRTQEREGRTEKPLETQNKEEKKRPDFRSSVSSQGNIGG
jgi:hypothetical protein